VIGVVAAQSITVSTARGAVRVESGLPFIEGEVLDRLRDGRSVRLDFELSVLPGPRGAVVAASRQSFNLSFDLWEERIAITKLGAPPRSISHLRVRDAETWCLENLSVPLSDLAQLGRDSSFWVRVAYAAPDAGAADSDSTLTLRRLIDVLSRREQTRAIGTSIVGGPYRLPH
jgi:hypothetical protein